MNRALLRAASALPRTRAMAPVPTRGLKKNPRIEEWNGMREDLQKSFQVDSSNSFGLFASILGLPILIYMYTKLDLEARDKADGTRTETL